MKHIARGILAYLVPACVAATALAEDWPMWGRTPTA